MVAATLLPDWIVRNPGLCLAGAIVLVGLFGLGLRDVLRFSVSRLWAISTVAAQQSIRGKVLWITPLVIVGVIIVCQFQKSYDAQDAIRQTIMICLFATGLLVTLVTIILACTNLPREIDTRVIYTIATKPATRLEIVAGKVVGFVRVSFWMLLIMGTFTWAYAHLRDWQMRSHLAAQLAAPGAVDQGSRPTLEYYRDQGTLHARDIGLPGSLSIYSHLPTSPEDRWSPGADEGEMIVRFTIDRSRIPAPEPAPAGPTVGPSAPRQGGLLVQIPIWTARSGRAGAPRAQQLELATLATTRPATLPASLQLPRVAIGVLNSDLDAVFTSQDFRAPQGWELNETGGVVRFFLTPEMLARLIPEEAAQGDLFLQIIGRDADYQYSTNPAALGIFVPETGYCFTPTSDVLFNGRRGQYGQQLRGSHGEQRCVAVYQFTGQTLQARQPSYAIEVRLGVERLEDDEATRVAFEFRNRKTGEHIKDIEAIVETNRPTYVNVPAAAVEGGEFDLVLHTASNAWLGLRAGSMASVKFIKGDESFLLNLLKSLLVLWLMSLLVTITSVFCSTFLSWPIAVVLTVVILSGRWAALQLGDVKQAGLGRQIVNDMLREASPASAKAVSESVDAIVQMMNTLASLLPDLSRFAAIQDVQQGVAISPAKVLLPCMEVAFGFGLPLLVLAYLFLRYKEVAP